MAKGFDRESKGQLLLNCFVAFLQSFPASAVRRGQVLEGHYEPDTAFNPIDKEIAL